MKPRYLGCVKNALIAYNYFGSKICLLSKNVLKNGLLTVLVAEEMSAALTRAQESINAKDALTLDMIRNARSAYYAAMWDEL